jgi:hypothetical protein
MSTLAMTRCNDSLAGLGSPAAGDIGKKVVQQAARAMETIKAGIVARSSFVFNDLFTLGEELGIDVRQAKVFVLAQRFLLALPANIPAPELSFDEDGDVSFDWNGPGGKLLSVALREDGRLAYASRLSEFDKDHGIKRFVDAIPKNVVDLLHQVNAS